MKKTILLLLKILLPVAIISWLVWNIDQEQLRSLAERPKDWPRLTAGMAMIFGLVCVSFFRWYLLVRALHLPFRVSEAFRLGFLCYLLNFVFLGSVGGDLFRAVFIARGQKGRRADAVATVIADRVAGVFALLVVTSCAILLTDIGKISPLIQAMCNVTLLATAIGLASAAFIAIPRVRRGRLVQSLGRVPKIGPLLGRWLLVVDMYGRKPGTLIAAGLLSVGIHVSIAVALFLVASALFSEPPTLGEHFIIVPLANVAGALPFTPAGLGTFELAMERLYVLVPAHTDGDGVIVALCYRLITIIVAAIGMVYYLTSRKEVSAIMAEAEHEAES